MVATQMAVANNWRLIHIVTLWIIPCGSSHATSPPTETHTQMLFAERDRERMRRASVQGRQRAERTAAACIRASWRHFNSYFSLWGLLPISCLSSSSFPFLYFHDFSSICAFHYLSLSTYFSSRSLSLQSSLSPDFRYENMIRESWLLLLTRMAFDWSLG